MQASVNFLQESSKDSYEQFTAGQYNDHQPSFFHGFVAGMQIGPIFALPLHGEMPERSNGAVSKTVDPFTGVPGFQSLSLRKARKKLTLFGLFYTFTSGMSLYRISHFAFHNSPLTFHLSHFRFKHLISKPFTFMPHPRLTT